VGDPISVDEPSTLGFSGADVLDLLSGEIVADAVDAADDSVEAHALTFTFTPGQTAQMEERTAAAGFEGSCVTGTTLAMHGTLEIEAADGWFSGSGPVELAARAADLASVWVDSTFDVAPSADLGSLAAERTGQSCDLSEVAVRYAIRELPSVPWAEGLGGLSFEFDGCSGSDLAGDGMLYTLVPSGG
jgi:hypothetical protein